MFMCFQGCTNLLKSALNDDDDDGGVLGEGLEV